MRMDRNTLTRVEYCPGNGTKYALLVGKAENQPGEDPKLFISWMRSNWGTCAIFVPGVFKHYSYVSEKLQCPEADARVIAHFINLRFTIGYAESLADEPNGPLNQGGLLTHLPRCLQEYTDVEKREVRKRTLSEILEVALSHEHGITYSEENREEVKLQTAETWKKIREMAAERDDVSIINLDEMEHNKRATSYTFTDSDIQNSVGEEYARDAMADAAETARMNEAHGLPREGEDLG